MDERERAARARAGQLSNRGARNSSRSQAHLAPHGSELHCVGEQVVDDLLHLSGVRAHGTQLFTGIHRQINLPARSLLPHDGEAVREQRSHLHRLDVEQHLAGFHLRQVEDVVD